ncbi:MAG: GNAT family N-acetyltransferase [Dehalococcoidia bacterium]|nr:GNAT family N-acetyltransferase [Dehalococcoidia bacterium]
MEIEVGPLADRGRVPRGDRAAGLYLVAREGDEHLGHVRLRWRGAYRACVSPEVPGDGPFLEDLFVEPAYRSRGVGSRLVAEAEELARALGGRRLELRVERSNLRARALYERLGYLEVGAADDHIAGSFIGKDGRPHRWHGEMLALVKDLEAPG